MFSTFEIKDSEGKTREFNLIGGTHVDNPTWIALKPIIMNNRRDDLEKRLLVLSLGTGLPNKDSPKVKNWSEFGSTYCREQCEENEVRICFHSLGCPENYLRIQEKELRDELFISESLTKANLEELVEVAERLLKRKAENRGLEGFFSL